MSMLCTDSRMPQGQVILSKRSSWLHQEPHLAHKDICLPEKFLGVHLFGLEVSRYEQDLVVAKAQNPECGMGTVVQFPATHLSSSKRMSSSLASNPQQMRMANAHHAW